MNEWPARLLTHPLDLFIVHDDDAPLRLCWRRPAAHVVAFLARAALALP
jgi:hypothetical protein